VHFATLTKLLSFSKSMNRLDHLPTLPAPDPAAVAHSIRLIEYIRAEMAANEGTLPFSRFMELALYAPGLGYYSAGMHKFGAGGDFVTAPELSPLFSRCIARQCQQVLAQVGGAILELGAGSGAMAAAMLRELERLDSLPDHYAILEISAELGERQQQTLATQIPHLWKRVVWLDTLPEPGWRGLIVGNEVVDAMPVERFRITPAGPVPLHVAWAEDRFVWREGEATTALTDAVNALQEALGFLLPPAYEAEFNARLPPWIAALAEVLTTGLVLLIDYGYPRHEYYHPARSSGTLRCHYRHRVHADPLILPGLQDITASVDFSALADAAVAAGLTVAGYTSQNYFLFGCGLESLLAEVAPTDTLPYLQLASQVKVLTLPEEMGERCKAIALSKGLDIPLQGFTFYDERRWL
jgi:SAM-dependent MidA family methyltransferase